MKDGSIPGESTVSFGEVCDRGKEREENQDSVHRCSTALGELMVVADGVGGYRGGATASRMVVEGFEQYIASLPDNYPPDQAIREASARVNKSIAESAATPNSPYRQMGSTVVLALLACNGVGADAWVGHVGDSRGYLARDGQLNRITKDHSAVQALMDCNLITPEQAANHPDASVLTRSLGHRPEVEIDISIVHLQAGDTLLLCSDGLWGYVPEAQIADVVVDPSLSVQQTAEALLALALAAGGHDNIGIELARIGSGPICR